MRFPRLNTHRWLYSQAWVAALALLVTVPVQAAEELVFSYGGPMESYLPVSSIETYVRDNKVDEKLANYFKYLKPEEQSIVRQALRYSSSLKPFPVSQVLYSPMGVVVLSSLGNLIQTGPEMNGFYAIRSAIILSATDPQGLSVLGVMHHFPSNSIRINVSLALQLASKLTQFVDVTNEVVQAIDTENKAQAASEAPINLATLPSVQALGPFQVSKQNLMLQDNSRNRNVPTDLYVPVFKDQKPTSIPVVVFSHGLGETREFNASYMELLASYGFVVAAPEHIGSDYAQQVRLLAGLDNEIFRPSEFYEQPRDVTYVLNVLQEKNANEFGGRLNLQNVGVFGNSFGGYTVLVLGGATVDFTRLRQDCKQDYLLQTLNISLLFQCRALDLESSPQLKALLTSGQLQDPRVKFVMAISPFTSAILGPSGISRIKVPVVLFGGRYDLAAPIVREQVEAFSWLTATDKYLLSSNAVSHSPQFTELINQFLLPSLTKDKLKEKISLFQKKFRGISLAFMQVYVAGKSEYRPYLQASYTETLADPPFNLSLIRSFPPDRLDPFLSKLP